MRRSSPLSRTFAMLGATALTAALIGIAGNAHAEDMPAGFDRAATYHFEADNDRRGAGWDRNPAELTNYRGAGWD